MLVRFTTDPEIKKRLFVPDNLTEGKEENRVLPWVFHDNDESKILQLKCIMIGYNVSNNPIDYKDARWSYPGFSDSQVNIISQGYKGEENGVSYAIWTIEIKTSAADAGKKWATCEFQQGDFPLSIDFTFLIFRKKSEETRQSDSRNRGKNSKISQLDGRTHRQSDFLGFLSKPKNVLFYDSGGFLDEKDINDELEDEIKMQISDHCQPPLLKDLQMDKNLLLNLNHN